ncbi:MAG: carbohydrate kinase family protein [Acidimicrobiia bacterium]|nr:carbohydrate kinase family protein [Acidimicrobiia bacterium]
MKALVLGGVAWNTMVYVEELPDPRPSTVFARSSHDTIGSSGAGKALNLRRVDVDVAMWAAVGDDEPGRLASERLRSEGVDLHTHVDPLGTQRHVNLMDAAGDRISIFANAGSDELEFDPASIEPLLEGCDLVTVTINNYCRQFLPLLAASEVPVWIDIHDYDGTDSYHQQFIEAADYLLASSIRLPEHYDFMVARIDAGASMVVVTHGVHGASALSADGESVDIEAVPVLRLVDTNGAGDAFFAGFAATHLGGGNLESSMANGAVLAAAAIQSLELAPDIEQTPELSAP